MCQFIPQHSLWNHTMTKELSWPIRANGEPRLSGFEPMTCSVNKMETVTVLWPHFIVTDKLTPVVNEKLYFLIRNVALERDALATNSSSEVSVRDLWSVQFQRKYVNMWVGADRLSARQLTISFQFSPRCYTLLLGFATTSFFVICSLFFMKSSSCRLD